MFHSEAGFFPSQKVPDSRSEMVQLLKILTILYADLCKKPGGLVSV